MSEYVNVSYRLEGEAYKVSEQAYVPADQPPENYVAMLRAVPVEQVIVTHAEPSDGPKCVTTSHWATHVSAECAPFGSGQCDGFCYTHGQTQCTCSCHEDWDLPQTVAEVKVWHDKANGVYRPAVKA